MAPLSSEFMTRALTCIRITALSYLLLLERGWKRLLELLGLGLICHDEGVQVLAAPDLELRLCAILLYLHRLCILAACNLQEWTNLGDLLWHGLKRRLRRGRASKTQEPRRAL